MTNTCECGKPCGNSAMCFDCYMKGYNARFEKTCAQIAKRMQEKGVNAAQLTEGMR